MPNTKSAVKAQRSSKNKKNHNLFWKEKIKDIVKSIKKAVETSASNLDILKKEESLLQKTLDKATKNNVIHKNKANRIKSKYAKRIAAHNSKSKS